MRKNVKALVLLCFLLLLGFSQATVVNAQTCGVPGLPDCLNDPDQSMPIDGGLSILLAAGAGYGIKKYRSEQKRKKEEQSNQSTL